MLKLSRLSRLGEQPDLAPDRRNDQTITIYIIGGAGQFYSGDLDSPIEK